MTTKACSASSPRGAGEANAFEVDIPGVPQSKGSLKAFRRGQGFVVTSTNRHLKAWAEAARWAVKIAWGRRLPFHGAVSVDAVFRMPRPKSSKRTHPTVRPDLDKLARAAGDILTGICYSDDSAVVRWDASKRYVELGEQPGVRVRVEAI